MFFIMQATPGRESQAGTSSDNHFSVPRFIGSTLKLSTEWWRIIIALLNCACIMHLATPLIKPSTPIIITTHHQHPKHTSSKDSIAAINKPSTSLIFQASNFHPAKMPTTSQTSKAQQEDSTPNPDDTSRPTGAGVNTGAGSTRDKTEAEREADRLYEERMEEEYAKREGGA